MDNHVNGTSPLFLGAGWSFPITFSAGNYQLNLTSNEENVNHSIDIILQTQKGERCLEPRFGSGLQQFLFRKMDETLKGEIIDAVYASLLLNEPRITVQEVGVEFTDRRKGLIEVSISYVYNQVNTRHNYVFPYSLNEGTNL